MLTNVNKIISKMYPILPSAMFRNLTTGNDQSIRVNSNTVRRKLSGLISIKS